MNLDWNFYYDSWLIDKVPDGLEIKVVDNGNGPKCIPSSLTCYFGANPIYLYGKGKLLHEVLFSPRGIAIYPEFLQRPGFEWVKRKSFDVRFESELDFHGNNVVAKHIGNINASQFMKDISSVMYGIEESQFTAISTPSSSLRKLNQEDIDLIDKGVGDNQVYANSGDMVANGIIFYSRMFMEDSRVGPMEIIEGSDLVITSPGAPILTPGANTDVLFLKYSHIDIPASYTTNMFESSGFCFGFKTLEQFRFGTIFDFGATNLAQGLNYGASLMITEIGIYLTLNDGGELNRFFLTASIDYRFPHVWLIQRDGDDLILIIDGRQIDREDISMVGDVVFDNAKYNNYISRRSIAEENEYAGDIEELFFSRKTMTRTHMDKYFSSGTPLLKKGGVSALEKETIPFALSYGLTFKSPTDFFIPNFFNADFSKFYLKNKSNLVIIATQAKKISSSYRDDLEPFLDKSLLIPTGYAIDQVLASENNGLAEEIPVLTKLSSDNHIPIRIHMDFVVPVEFYDKNTVFNMRIVLKSLDKFAWYSYEKFKTGEFV